MLYYQVGGSLASQEPSYIARQADDELLRALERGEFCYVFNARQMGKSSLLVRTKSALEQTGYRCSVLDMTSIGSENITPLQWYGGLIYNLWREFGLDFKIKQWQQQQEGFSLLQQLSYFLLDQLLDRFPDEQLVIFIDEIDGILSLPFTVDDFFALVRFCYNQRSLNPEYQRLTFALFGVATPSDLIRELRRTPFNIGRPIALDGFTFTEAQILAEGIELAEGDSNAILTAILSWTNGQPFLTQKLCQLVVDVGYEQLDELLRIPAGTEADWVDALVRDRLLTHWESNDEPEHLRTIRNRILRDPNRSGRLLGIYQQVRSPDLTVRADDSPEQRELLLSGLVLCQGSTLQVKNRLYGEIFSLDWVEQQLANLRPYAQLLATWVASERQDESRLLRGQALRDALIWSQGKQLSDLDYQYLRASEESDRRAETLARDLAQERQTAKLQRRFLSAVTGALVLAIGLGGFTFWQYRQARRSEQAAIRSEIDALISASNGNYNSNQRLDATIEAIRAHRELERLDHDDLDLRRRAQAALRQAIYTANEENRLALEAALLDVVISPDDSLVAIAGGDGSITLLHPTGKIIRQFKAHKGPIRQLAFSPDGTLLASASADRTLKLWQPDGTLVSTLARIDRSFRSVTFSPDGEYLATTEQGWVAKIWRLDGELVTTLPNSGVLDFSPDGQWLVTAGEQAMVQLWQWPLPANLPPQPHRTFQVQPDPRAGSQHIVFSPDSQKLGLFLRRQNPQILQLDGTPIVTFDVEMPHQSIPRFTPDSEQFIMASTDNELLFGHLDGSITQRLPGHQANILSSAITADDKHLVTVAEDGSVRFWQRRNPFRQQLLASRGLSLSTMDNSGMQVVTGSPAGVIQLWQRQSKAHFPSRPQYRQRAHQSPIHDVTLSQDGQRFVSVARDGQVKSWNTAGELLQMFQLPHGLWSVALSSDQQWLAVGAYDGKIYLWQQLPSGQYSPQPQILSGHRLYVRDLVFSPDGQRLVSGSADRTVKVWDVSSQTVLKTLTGHSDAVWGVAISPDGQWIASTATDRTVRLWQWERGETKVLRGHQGGVLDVTFGADGKTLWTGGADGTVKRWDLQGRVLWELPHGALRIQRVSVDAAEETLVASGFSPQVWVWSLATVLNTDELVYACNWLKDYLTHNAPRGDRDLCVGVQTEEL
ncbi:MAG: hypothetical protein F6J87_05100 [Spirulina sp. SIO3F2]|nr:hypothetical protein [Spirulina sp. SIO3F2]